MNGKKICAMVADRKGNVWVSTTMGLYEYDSTDKKIINHINSTATREYMPGAVMCRNDGMIGFGTGDGITAFYPEEVKHFKNDFSRLYLTKFIVDGKTEDCLSDHFNIPYDENTFSMDFSMLRYRNTDEISLQYRLNGGQWISTDEGMNRITFNKMKAGDYRLQVRTASNGYVSDYMTTINFRVLNPWYATTAIIIYSLVFVCLSLLVIHYFDRKRKREMEEAKIKFLINTTHDIRSPLTLILGPIQKLKAMVTDNNGQHYLETISRNANRLLLLVNQILDQRKIDRKLMKLHCRRTDLIKAISNDCMLFEYNARQRSIRLVFEHSAEELFVWIDRINFDKVMCNVISNALKYTPDGGNITVKVESGNDNAHISVTDDGIGLDGVNTDKIFDSFYQGRNSGRNNISGSGIGLSVSRMIIEMHGGKITAHRRRDGKTGACFDISIPLGNSHLRPEEIDEDEQGSDNRQKKMNSNINVMVVDDDEEICMYICNELSSYYRLKSYHNGNEAMHALLSEHFDIVISDVVMPEMDGIELLKQIKGNSLISDIPVILLTSKAEVDDRIEGLKRGADAFIAKPFDINELRTQVDNLIDNVRRLRGKFSGAQSQNDKREDIEMEDFNDELMARIMKAINDNIADANFNVDKLCDTVGISRTHLHRKMKEITGISASDFLRNIRLDQAARLIREHKVSISTVAYSVGFSNSGHFSTVFKKRFGMTPKEYSERREEQS
jgi:signal transduction histidine kinase/DNA-binding response OmpR family regulator